MRIYFFKLLLFIVVLTLSTGTLFAQYEWEKWPTNPLNIHGSPGSWDESVVSPCVIFNPDSNRYEMWYTAYDGSFPNGGIGFAWSSDGITWTKNPTPVMTPGATGWDSLFVGADCVRKEGSTYKMWYTGWKSTTRYPHSIGYATSTDGINWTKYSGNPVLTPGTGWESGAVGYPSLIKVNSGYWMFYTGEVSLGVALTGRAFSTDGITWQKDLTNNPVLLAGGPGTWDRNNYLGRVIELNNFLYIYYTAEDNPGVSGSAIGFATSIDTGKTWSKYAGNPVIERGAVGSWDNWWIETGEVIFTQNELRLYYDGGGAATGFLGRVGLAISSPLPAGTYTIGAGGNFATIQDAFNKLETDGVAGAVTLELIDDLYTAPTTPNGFFLNGPIPGAGTNSRVTIKPALNKNVTIEGSGKNVFYFVNTSYLTLDGVDLTGATTLTILALYNASFQWNTCLDFINNSDYNVVQNITFISEDYTRLGGGPGFWTADVGSSLTTDNNLIQNNFIKKAGIAIYVDGYESTTKATGNIIRENKIGSETDSLITTGIQLQGSQNSLVENNVVQNLAGNNGSADYLNRGINSYAGIGDTIRNNTVHSIKATTGYTAVGILLSGDASKTGSNNVVYNNMIYDIQSTSTNSDSRVAGIQMWYQNNPKVYYNSVYLSGTGTNQLGSAALYIYGNCTNVDAKNNIFVNTRDESPYYASSIYDYEASNLTSDYNDLYSNNYLVRIGSTNYNTLAEWQATGKDLNSLNEIVNFISPTDLHINNNYYTLLDGHATPITGIDVDLDGDTRNATNPDIGADEFDLDPNATIWQLQNSHFPSDVVIDDFSAPNDQVCWAVSLKYPPYVPYVGYIRTIDGGNTWVCDTIPGLSNCYTQEIFAIDADTAYVAVYKLIGTSGSKGIYKTTDAGATWIRQEAYNNSQSGAGYIHFFDAQNGLVVGDPNLETYTTTNGGLTWNPVTMPAALTDEYTAGRGDGIFAIGNTVWFSTGARLYKSTDKGYTWTILLDEPQYIDWSGGIAFQDELRGIYSQKQVGSTNHLYRKTTDGGVNWEDLSNPILDQIAATTSQYIPGTGSTYFVGGSTAVTMSGIAASYDGGNTWSLIDTVGSYQFIFPSSTVGWNSPFTNRNIYKYVGPRIVSSVEEEQIVDLIPTGYSLLQNYPNPFNPTTTIRYSIPYQSKVVIKVYDILGIEVTTLMDEEKSIGTYELTWNAINLPSGVYFYQLKAGEFLSTKKMILLK